MSTSLNIEEILTNLKNTYQSPDKNIRTQSEKKLSELKDQNILSFSSQLIDLLKLSLKEVDKNLRMSIILLLKRSIKEKIDKKALDNDSCNQLIQLYISIIVNPNMSQKEIENLKESFITLLNNTKGEILIEIIKYINKQISSIPLGSVNGVVTVLSAIISCSSMNKNIFPLIIEGILNMSGSILENLYSKYESINIENNMDDYLKLNSIFLNMFDLFFHCGNKYNKNKGKDEKILKILNNILIIGAKLLVNLKATDSNRLISWTGDKKIDKNINNMKVGIFRYLNSQLNYLEDIIMDKTKIENHNQLIKIIMANLEWIIMNKYTYIIKLESDDNYPDYSYTLIISYMFIYLKRILNKDNFIQEFTNIFNSMYKNILLPLLVISDIEEEIALDNDSVNGYLIDINDIISNNKQKKIKSGMAGLLKNYYMKNAISRDFMINYSVGLLNNLILNYNLEDKNLFEPNDIIILLIKAYPKEKIICALFLALNIFSICDNKSNDNTLSLFFQKVYQPLTSNINYPCLKHQIILFIKNYALRFYESDSIAFETSVKYLFESLFEMKYLLISNSSADAIQSFFIDNEDRDDFSTIKITLLKVATLCSSNFEKQILEIQISNFFDVLYQFMLNFEKTANEFFQKIFINLCQRVSVEVERHYRLKFIVKKEKNKAKKKAAEQTNLNDYKIIINKCFNIIRLLINDKRFVINNNDIIEQSLKPLFDYMDEPKKIGFDEDLVYIMYMIITHHQKLTGMSFGLIKNLYKYCNKTGGLCLDLYQLINAYLAYGSDQILCNKKWVEGIFAVFKSGINSEKYDKSGLYTSILVQTWVMHSAKLPENYLSDLINNIVINVYKIYQNYKKTKSTGDDKYNFLGYVTLLLTCLINYSNLTLSIIKQKNNQNCFKEWLNMITKDNEPIYEYEIKIIIYTICMIIKKRTIGNDMPFFLNISIELLKIQESNAKYELKKNTKKILNISFVEDNDDDDDESKDDDETENEDLEYKEIKELVAKTLNPVKDMDEFKNFKDLLTYLKMNHSNEYTMWENSLSIDKKEEVNKLFGTKRIIIQCDKKSSMQVPRRIVSIRRNPNNGGNP